MTPAFGDYYRTLAAYNAKLLEFPVDLETRDWGKGTGTRGQSENVSPSPTFPQVPKLRSIAE